MRSVLNPLIVACAIVCGGLVSALAQPVHPQPPAVPVAPKADVTPAPKAADAPAKLARGGKRSPGHKLAAAPKFHVTGQPPAKFAMIPAALGMYGNDTYGDCVSAQEAVSLVAYTTYCGSPVKPTDAEVVAFARKYGLLNGADLTQVMDIMATKGMTVGGKVYKDGGYAAVDYSVPLAMQSALCVGPVNVAIDADALPAGAGNQQGWYALGSYRPGQYPNTDHCVTLLGYGTAADCFAYLKVPPPAGIDLTQQAYLLDTWKTIGVVNQSWVMSTMAEAWVRNPTTVEACAPVVTQLPTPPPAPPTPPPAPPVPPIPPGPPGAGFTGTLTYANGVLVAVTPGAAPAVGVEAELKSAGVSPAVIADVLQLLADVKGKKGLAAITADLMRILADFTAAEPAPKVGRAEPAERALAA
jgi:hypothetical protein